MGNTLEYLLKLDAGAFEGPMSKARGSMRGAKSDAEALNSSVVNVGKQGAAGFAALGAGMLLAGGSAAKSEGVFKRLFHAVESGVGGTARVLRAGGGVTQLGAMFARQIPAMSKYRDSLKAVEDRAHRMNSKLETLAGMGGKNHSGGGVLAVFRANGGGGGQVGGGQNPSGGGGAGRAAGGIGAVGLLKGGMFAGALAGIMGGVKASSSAAAMESSEIAFKSLIGDATKAKTTLKELFDFAADTPFQMPEVQSSAVKLMAAGVAATDLSGSLSVLGNVTAGYQADLGAVATIYAQVVNKGKLYAEELQQFGENGVPALRLVADALGKTTAEVMAMGTAGELSASDLAKAFNMVGGAGGKLANAMSDQAASTQGLWSTLSDTINRMFIVLGNPINDFMRPMLRQAIDYAGKLAVALEASIAGFRAALEGGKLGAALSATLRVGMAEFSIFAAKSFGQLAQGAAVLFSTALSGNVGQGQNRFVNFFSGIADVIRAEIGGAFDNITADWIASMAVGMGKIQELMGGPKALSHAEYKAQALDAGEGNDNLRQRGQDKIRGAFGNPLQDMADAMGGSAFAGMWRAWADTTKEGIEKGTDAAKNGLSEAVAEGMTEGEAKTKAKTKSDKIDEAEKGRKKIKGFSYKASGANAGFGGIDEYKRLQEHTGKVDNGKRYGGAYVNKAFADGAFKMPKEIADAKTPGEVTAPGGMKKRMMGGNDDFFNGVKRPPIGAPRVAPPGAAKNTQARQAAAVAAAVSQKGSHPLAALIKSLDDKLGKIAVA